MGEIMPQLLAVVGRRVMVVVVVYLTGLCPDSSLTPNLITYWQKPLVLSHFPPLWVRQMDG